MSNTGNYIGTPWGIILCVDYYRDEKINGRIYHRYQTEPIRIGGMLEAVFEIDAFFDRLGYPFPGTESHYFIKHEKTQRIKMTRKLSDEEMLKNNGEKGTFIIRVEQRQHSSWQGRVTWVELPLGTGTAQDDRWRTGWQGHRHKGRRRRREPGESRMTDKEFRRLKRSQLIDII